eukprot:2091474-Rhodomonas_salina.2
MSGSGGGESDGGGRGGMQIGMSALSEVAQSTLGLVYSPRELVRTLALIAALPPLEGAQAQQEEHATTRHPHH